MRTIADAAEFIRGVSYRKDESSNEPRLGLRPVLRATNIVDGGLVLDADLVFVPDGRVKAEQRLVVGDIVVATSSGSAAVVGKSAALTREWDGAFGAFCGVLRPIPTVVDPRYLAHFVHSSAVREAWSRLALGTNINNLKAADILATPIRLPPLDEQRRIVDAIEQHLSHLDAGVASLQRATRNLERMRSAVLRDGASGRLIGLDTDPATGVPSHWEIVSVGDECEVQGGITKNSKRAPALNAFPYLRVANVQRNRLDLDEVHEFELLDGELDRYRLLSGDLLVVEGNGSPSQIGRSAMWGGEIEDCVHQNHIIRVRPSARLVPEFLNLHWNSPRTAQELMSVASSTSGLFTLSTGKVKSVKVPIPSMDEQQAIVAEVERQLSLLDALSAETGTAVRRSASLRGATLATAFSEGLSDSSVGTAA